jgi:hypothetical protein
MEEGDHPLSRPSTESVVTAKRWGGQCGGTIFVVNSSAKVGFATLWRVLTVPKSFQIYLAWYFVDADNCPYKAVRRRTTVPSLGTTRPVSPVLQTRAECDASHRSPPSLPCYRFPSGLAAYRTRRDSLSSTQTPQSARPITLTLRVAIVLTRRPPSHLLFPALRLQLNLLTCSSAVISYEKTVDAIMNAKIRIVRKASAIFAHCF